MFGIVKQSPNMKDDKPFLASGEFWLITRIFLPYFVDRMDSGTLLWKEVHAGHALSSKTIARFGFQDLNGHQHEIPIVENELNV